jgi:tetraprenyl-beta-curcumene synthase
VSAFADRRLLARAGIALLLANLRYWPTVAPLVRAQLEHYRQHARTIRDPILRTLALDKLNDQRFHAQVAATLATLAQGKYRKPAAEAIVALEVMYDYLDALTERPTPDPVKNGLCLSRAFTDAVSIHDQPTGNYYALNPQKDDSGYMETLVTETRQGLAQLPAIDAIIAVAKRSAARFSEAQVRAHATTQLGSRQLEEWATRESKDSTLDWLEYFAGATSSVLGLHALIAAAADHHTTPTGAVQIDTVYLYIGVIVTMLDSLIDYERDISTTGQPGYTRYYEAPELLTKGLTNATQHAIRHAQTTPHGAHHIMTLVGVVAFYTSAPTATNTFANPVTTHIQKELQPLMTPTIAVMRAWRFAKRIRNQRAGKPSTTSPV